MGEKKQNVLQYVLIALIAVTVLSFFIHSLMPREISAEESDGVASILSTVIPPDTPVGAFIVNNIRKIAHFCEYGLLGIELAIYGALFVESKKRAALMSLVFAHATAFIDESLQIISGRGPSITDVWLDLFGYVVLYLLTCAAIFAIRKLRSKEK
ncbi:MAG: VanZ family protein [Clostridia bacterium]|nr:VanZ family protein [Clostridia bacterium]